MKLALGTVQFGLDYGIANTSGRPLESEVKSILTAAAENNVDLLDTSPEYGEAESLLGRLLPDDQETGISPNIVTKIPSMSGVEREDISATVKWSFENSLSCLKRHKIYGLLVHHCDDLLGDNGEDLYAAAVDSKDRGLVDKIGVSVYDAKQIDAVVQRHKIDLIQLPVNVLDQRLIKSGHLSSLRRAGIEIHVRSAFLQGVLLMSPEELPGHLFALKGTLADFHDAAAEQGLTPVSAALGFLRQQTDIDCILVGVQNARELKEVATSFVEAKTVSLNCAGFDSTEDALVNPAIWPRT